YFNPGLANTTNVIRYTFTDGITGCSNYVEQNVIVNEITAAKFKIEAPGTNDADEINIALCENSGVNNLLTLIGSPPASTGFSPTLFKSPDPYMNSRIVFDGIDYKINTLGITGGPYIVQYIYTNSVAVRDTVTKVLTIYAGPTTSITSGDDCIDGGGPTIFTQNTIFNNPNGDIITDWIWNFGDGGFGTGPSPSHQYSLPGGVKNVTLVVTTNNNCTDTFTKAINIGIPPVPDFKRSSFCLGDVTQFTDDSEETIGTINSYLWDFGDGTPTSSLQNPTHTYGTYQTYDVTLTIGTSANCSADTTKTIFILDSPTAVAVNPYRNNFEAGSGSWYPVINYDLSGDKTSWQFGTPSGMNITTAASGVNAWWTGANSQSYYDNEESFVIGPCLNLDGLSRPMISLNYWSDTQIGYDGAILQYSTNGGADWIALGDAEGNGINWYNSRNIVGSPGDVTNYAWSDTTKVWRNSRYNLEVIDPTERGIVIFRIAFGSDGNTRTKQDGFAFDDIYIGEKTRNVLVEHFTNDSDGSSELADDYLDNLYATSYDFNNRDSSDFIKIQYHIANPGFDQINGDNPDDPSARRIFYGLSKPPVSIMDGIVGPYYGSNFNGTHTSITDKELDRRALEDPSFDIKIVETVGADENRLQLNLQFTYIDTLKNLNKPVILHAALVESGVIGSDGNVNTNYLRKLLLQAEGRYIDKTWTSGDQESIDVDYKIDVPIAFPDDLSVIAFVQNYNSSLDSVRMLQAIIQKISRKTGSTVVAVENDPADKISAVNMYPNPVSNTLNLQLESELHHDYEWKMIDQRGIVVLEGKVNRDLSSPQQVDVSRLASGIYFMAIQSGEKSVVYRKIAVINRN
nr:PKD domain-containing protein [Chryseolinea sp.]